MGCFISMANNNRAKGEIMSAKLIDTGKIQEEALAEFMKERSDAAKKKIKAKMKEIDDAELVVRNLKREMDDLLKQLTE